MGTLQPNYVWHSDIYVSEIKAQPGYEGTFVTSNYKPDSIDIIFAKLKITATKEKRGKTKSVYQAVYSVIKVPFDGIKPIITLDLKLQILQNKGAINQQRYTNQERAIRDVISRIKTNFDKPHLLMKAEHLFVEDEVDNFLNKYMDIE